MAKSGSGIASGADLEGKRLAVNTRNNIIWLYAKAWVDATGGDADSVTYLEVPFPQMLDAVAGDQVDAAFLVDPFFTAGTSSGAVELVGWPYNAIQPQIPVGMYATTESYLAENPEVIANFVSAYNKAVDWANDNAGTDEWAEIVASYTRLTPDRLSDLQILPFFKTIDPDRLQPTLDLMVDYDLLRSPIEAADMLHDTVTAQ
ncbi:MAG: NMT1/THI5 like [Rhodobacteraceae bacterium HLUCCA24]|nr:MAG: NMT1/THI5 like [Rhodobacteraceae bacterium HLUCCA24]